MLSILLVLVLFYSYSEADSLTNVNDPQSIFGGEISKRNENTSFVQFDLILPIL